MDDPLAAARQLVPTIRERRDATERDRRLAGPIVDQLIDKQLCRMALPEELKGLALPPDQMLDVYEILAGAEASVPWIAWNNSLVCYFSRFLPEAVRREVFADPTWLYAQSTRPCGIATAEGGGYRVRGRWDLVSGCELADWLLLHCRVEGNGAGGQGEPETRFLLVRRGGFEILDTWHSGGLRGSGSHDVQIDGTWVPAKHSIAPGTESTLRGPLGRVPIVCNLGAGFAAQLLGIARTALAEIVDAGRTRVSAGPAPDLRDRPPAQAAVASHAAALEAARTHLWRCVGELWSEAGAARPPSLAAIGRVHAAALHADEAARAAVEAMYALGGTRSLYTSCPLERAHRDLHAMLRHVVAQPLWVEQAGRVIFGLAPTEPLYAL